MNTISRGMAAAAGFAIAIAGLGIATTPTAAATTTPPASSVAYRSAGDPLRGTSGDTCVQYLIDHLVPVGCDTPGVAVYRVVERGVVSETLCPAEADYIYTSSGGVDIYGPVTCLQKI